MKTAFIVPYFGKLPNYFQLFLDSCSHNPDFDWLIFTDDVTTFNCPNNVYITQMDFDECISLVQSAFDFPISLHTPQKLCDFKCAYGYIFSDFLREYDWWGHCDLDQIWGDLSAFITKDMLHKYSKIGSLGHLTLYRNSPENNRVFMSTPRYREVFASKRGCGFDEWLPGNINELYLETCHPVYLQNIGADVYSYRTTFQTAEFNIASRSYVLSQSKNTIFLWDHGALSQIYEDRGVMRNRTFPYVHLQKRAMKDCREDRSTGKFYIIPNRFVDGGRSPAHLLAQAAYRGIINTQFLIVKWKSFRYRLKSGDWKFDNACKME